MTDQNAILRNLQEADKEKRVKFSSGGAATHKALDEMPPGSGMYDASIPGLILVGLLGLEKALEHLKQVGDSGVSFIRDHYDISEVAFLKFIFAHDYDEAKRKLEEGTFFDPPM